MDPWALLLAAVAVAVFPGAATVLAVGGVAQRRVPALPDLAVLIPAVALVVVLPLPSSPADSGLAAPEAAGLGVAGLITGGLLLGGLQRRHDVVAAVAVMLALAALMLAAQSLSLPAAIAAPGALQRTGRDCLSVCLLLIAAGAAGRRPAPPRVALALFGMVLLMPTGWGTAALIPALLAAAVLTAMPAPPRRWRDHLAELCILLAGAATVTLLSAAAGA